MYDRESWALYENLKSRLLAGNLYKGSLEKDPMRTYTETRMNTMDTKDYIQITQLKVAKRCARVLTGLAWVFLRVSCYIRQ